MSLCTVSHHVCWVWHDAPCKAEMLFGIPIMLHGMEPLPGCARPETQRWPLWASESPKEVTGKYFQSNQKLCLQTGSCFKLLLWALPRSRKVNRVVHGPVRNQRRPLGPPKKDSSTILCLDPSRTTRWDKVDEVKKFGNHLNSLADTGSALARISCACFPSPY